MHIDDNVSLDPGIVLVNLPRHKRAITIVENIISSLKVNLQPEGTWMIEAYASSHMDLFEAWIRLRIGVVNEQKQ